MLLILSQTLQSGEVQLLKSHDHMLLSLKCSSKQVDLTLYELSAANKRVEMQTLIFMLWDTLQTTRIKLQGMLIPMKKKCLVIRGASRGEFMQRDFNYGENSHLRNRALFNAMSPMPCIFYFLKICRKYKGQRPTLERFL